MFAKQNSHIVANAYTQESEDFTGKISTSLLDTWVFDKATDFLYKNSKNLLRKEKVVFFLHLLGLDTGRISTNFVSLKFFLILSLFLV